MLFSAAALAAGARWAAGRFLAALAPAFLAGAFLPAAVLLPAAAALLVGFFTGFLLLVFEVVSLREPVLRWLPALLLALAAAPVPPVAVFFFVPARPPDALVVAAFALAALRVAVFALAAFVVLVFAAAAPALRCGADLRFAAVAEAVARLVAPVLLRCLVVDFGAALLRAFPPVLPPDFAAM